MTPRTPASRSQQTSMPPSQRRPYFGLGGFLSATAPFLPFGASSSSSANSSSDSSSSSSSLPFFFFCLGMGDLGMSSISPVESEKMSESASPSFFPGFLPRGAAPMPTLESSR